jgi:hypothetical protein
MSHSSTLTAPLALPPIAARAGVLTDLLRPFAERAHVFVADDAGATTVRIHKSAALDVELVIRTGEWRWSAKLQDAAHGRVLESTAASYRDRPRTEARDAMLADLRTFLTAVVDQPVAHLRFAR